jgi:hypothetical protein
MSLLRFDPGEVDCDYVRISSKRDEEDSAMGMFSKAASSSDKLKVVVGLAEVAFLLVVHTGTKLSPSQRNGRTERKEKSCEKSLILRDMHPYC